MITKNKNVLSTTRLKVSPLSQLLLLFSYSIVKNPIFILIMIIPKYIPIFIITSNFTWKLKEETENNFYISYYLRKFELVNLLPKIDIMMFYYIGIILFIVEFIFFTYCFYYFFEIKNHRGNKIILAWYPKLMFYMNTIFSQYIVEYYSFTFLLFFKKKLILPTSSIFSTYSVVPIITDDKNYNTIFIGILSVIQFLFLILINIFTFYSFIILNSSYRTTIPTLRFTHLYRFYFFVFFTDLSCIEYYEIFMTDNGRFKFKLGCFIVIFIILVLDVITNIRTYEENNYFFFTIRYLNNYGLVSIIFETISSLKNFKFSVTEVFIFTFFKLFLTFFTLYMLIYFRGQFMLHLSKTYLFETYDETHLTQMLECFNYILDQLIEIKNRTNNANEITNVLILHQKSCLNEQCKCKEIQPIPICGIKINEEFTNKLVRGFGFLMETCFANNKDSYNNIPFSLFLAEYFYHVKENLILSYSLLQSCLSLNIAKMDFLEGFEINNNNNFYISKFKDMFKNSSASAKFYRIFDNIFERMEFNRNIIKYCKSFDELIDSKMSFENSLKFVTDPDTNEILSIDSIFLSREVLLKIISKLSELSKISKIVKKNLIAYSNERKGTEFYYLTFLFYSMFSNKIPQEILKTFDNIGSGGESFKTMELDEMHNKFNFYVDKYIMSESAMNQLIIKFSKGIKIKYCSSNFCNQLGFIQSSLLKDDFANLFPKSLRISHTKAMLHYIMVGQNYFLKKDTYIFDSDEHSMPCEVRGGALPHFGKSLMMILQVLIKKNKNWSFILDNKYTCLSISREVEEEYFFNLNTLRKCDTDVIDLFDINPNEVKEKFKDTLSVIDKVKDELVFNDLENFSKNLFHLNMNGELDDNDKLFIPNSKSLEISNSNEDLCDTSVLFGKKRETIEFIRNKPIMIQNIIKALNKLGDSAQKDIAIKKLLKFLLTVRKNGGTEGVDINYLNLGLASQMSLSNKEMNDLGDHIENSTLQIMFKGSIQKLYDIPIYIFEFRDIMSNEDGYNSLHYMTFADNTLAGSTQKTKKNKNASTNMVTMGHSLYNANKGNKSLFNPSLRQSNNTSVIDGGLLMAQGSVVTADQLGDGNQNSRANNVYDKNSKEYKEALKRSKENKLAKKRIEIISYILMALCFCLSLTNVIYQLLRIKRVETIGTFFIYSSNLQDKMEYFQSNLITQSFEFGKYSHMTLTEDELLNYLAITTETLQESIRKFYKEINKYDKKTGNSFFSEIYGDFKKIIKTWESTSYYSDVLSELYYAIYLSNSVVTEDNIEEIEKDVEKFFFNEFKANIYERTNTNFIKVLYFIVNNYSSVLYKIIDNLYVKSFIHFSNYLKSSKKIVLIMEIFWLLTNISFFAISLLLFSKFNRRVFKLILSMFLDNQKNEKGTFKNRPENFYMKQKINLYILLLDNFTMENKIAFTNFKTNFLKSGGYLGFLENKKEQSSNELLINNSKNNISSSVLTTSNQVTSQNLLSTSHNNANNLGLLNEKNNLIKKHKPVPGAVDSHTNKSKNMMSNKDAAISNNELLKLLNQQRITISNFMTVIVVFFFLLCLVIFYLHLKNIITYNKDNETIRDCFNTFVTYFLTLPNIINSVRKLIMTQGDIEDALLNYASNISKYEKDMTEMTSSSQFKIFNKIDFFWKQVNLELDNDNIDYNYLCSDYQLCEDYLTKSIDNGFCADGIILGYELIAQKFGQIINDYKKLLNDNNQSLNKILIKANIMSNDFDRIQENIELIFSQVQNQFYKSFIEDYESIKDRLFNSTLILNIIFFLFEICVILVMTCGIELYMKKKEYLVKDGSKLFNSAFFKDPLPLV